MVGWHPVKGNRNILSHFMLHKPELGTSICIFIYMYDCIYGPQGLKDEFTFTFINILIKQQPACTNLKYNVERWFVGSLSCYRF